MCWSGEASFAVASVGAVAAGYLKYKGAKWDRVLPPLYFCLMEALQGFGYMYVNMCDLYPNKAIALISYLHICFQPFFLSMLHLSFVDDENRKKTLSKIMYTASAVGCGVLIAQLFHFGNFGKCIPGKESLCGDILCTYKGNWHIAWKLPLQRIDTARGLSYVLPVFFLPLFLGLWPFPVFHVITGPYFASLMTNDVNETPAIWCLLSEFLLMALYIKPLNNWIHRQTNNISLRNNLLSFVFVCFVYYLIGVYNPGY